MFKRGTNGFGAVLSQTLNSALPRVAEAKSFTEEFQALGSSLSLFREMTHSSKRLLNNISLAAIAQQQVLRHILTLEEDANPAGGNGKGWKTEQTIWNCAYFHPSVFYTGFFCARGPPGAGACPSCLSVEAGRRPRTIHIETIQSCLSAECEGVVCLFIFFFKCLLI